LWHFNLDFSAFFGASQYMRRSGGENTLAHRKRTSFTVKQNEKIILAGPSQQFLLLVELGQHSLPHKKASWVHKLEGGRGFRDLAATDRERHTTQNDYVAADGGALRDASDLLASFFESGWGQLLVLLCEGG
jgi:hypothetical protein